MAKLVRQLDYYLRKMIINVGQLCGLVDGWRQVTQTESQVEAFSKKYGLKLQFEDLQTLAETATRINKRELTRQTKRKQPAIPEDYEIFVFGELKIFNWALALYACSHHFELPDHPTPNPCYSGLLDCLEAIFKRKTRLFLEYQVLDIGSSKSKTVREWQTLEIDLFKDIMSAKKNESEWKAISYALFSRSQAKYFRPFTVCRQKWISHLNPNIKRTDWNLEEDVELFTLIQSYGCRWALISRQLKGMRSQHSVKNRFHVVVRTIKRQYRLGDSQQLYQKILKYLKMKLEKANEKKQVLNSSGDSLDSKGSRERSREEQKVQVSESESEPEEDNSKHLNVFDIVYGMEALNTESQTDRELVHDYLLGKGEFEGSKKEKRTNDVDEEEESEVASAGVSDEHVEVRTSTLEQLDRQYSRLLNWGDKSESHYFYLDDDYEKHNPGDGSCWLHEREENGINWLDLQS